MANSTEPSRSNLSATLWPLLTGLAFGFIVGQKVGSSGHASDAGDAAKTATAEKADVPAGTKLPDKVYKSQDEFPAGWTKAADLTSVTTVSFEGLTEAQRVTALQALNERDCECGCGMGKIAGCIKKDPNCPRSPNLAKLAIDMAKQGKGLPEILAAIDDKQKPAAGAPAPSAPVPPGAGFCLSSMAARMAGRPLPSFAMSMASFAMLGLRGQFGSFLRHPASLPMPQPHSQSRSLSACITVTFC